MDLTEQSLTKWTQTQVDEVARAVGPLPDDYRDFVLQVGTGSLYPHRILPGTGAIVTCFSDPIDLLEKDGGFDLWISNDYLLVMKGDGGALTIRKSDGRVFFANYDKGVAMGLDVDPSEDIMSEYAPGWSAIIEQIPTWKPDNE